MEVTVKSHEPRLENFGGPELLSYNANGRLVFAASRAQPTNLSTGGYEGFDEGIIVDAIARNKHIYPVKMAF